MQRLINSAPSGSTEQSYQIYLTAICSLLICSASVLDFVHSTAFHPKLRAARTFAGVSSIRSSCAGRNPDNSVTFS